MGEPTFGKWHSHGRGAPEILGQVPASCLAEEISTPGEGQLRGLITSACNPVISVPGSDQLDKALSELECMISLDTYLNETTRHAHVILPAPSPLESGHFDNVAPAWAVRSVARWSDPVVPKPATIPDEWQSLLVLHGLISGQPLSKIDINATDDGYFEIMCSVKNINPVLAKAATDLRGPERLVDWEIRTGPFGDRYGEIADGWTLARLREHPHGIDLGPMVPRAHEAICTPNGRINLAPEYIVGDIPRLAQRLESGAETSIVLVSRRHLRSNNSWLHNVDTLMKGRDRCTLLIHPDDAQRLDLSADAPARVISGAGELDVQIEISDEMMAGVVCLPHGWGHDKPGTQMAIARRRPGVNNNRLAPVDFLDALSGNAAVNGIPVQIEPIVQLPPADTASL